MRGNRGIVFIVVLFFIALSLGNENTAGSTRRSRTSEEDAIAYWTEERMRTAQPADLVVSDEDVQFAHEAPNMRSASDFEPTMVEGKDSILFPSYRYEEMNATFNETHSKRAYPYPFTSAYAPSYTTFPWQTVGKVFYTSGGQNWMCSGSVVRQHVVATAGHCVYNPTNGWHTNWIFVPGYNNGYRPWGTWAYHQLTVSYGWYTSGSLCRDYGFAVIKKNSNGYGVGDMVGYLGYMYNAAYSLSWRAMGYPVDPPFNGEVNYYVDSALGNTATPNGCTPAHLGIGSDASGGVSGGPWIYITNGLYYINSVNSQRYQSEPLAIWGPYFDTTWYNDLMNANSITPL